MAEGTLVLSKTWFVSSLNGLGGWVSLHCLSGLEDSPIRILFGDPHPSLFGGIGSQPLLFTSLSRFLPGPHVGS